MHMSWRLVKTSLSCLYVCLWTHLMKNGVWKSWETAEAIVLSTTKADKQADQYQQ